ncbi:MAG: hypothetical protein R3B72_24565 [Polyangiaceae bacterium]
MKLGATLLMVVGAAGCAPLPVSELLARGDLYGACRQVRELDHRQDDWPAVRAQLASGAQVRLMKLEALSTDAINRRGGAALFHEDALLLDYQVQASEHMGESLWIEIEIRAGGFRYKRSSALWRKSLARGLPPRESDRTSYGDELVRQLLFSEPLPAVADGAEGEAPPDAALPTASGAPNAWGKEVLGLSDNAVCTVAKGEPCSMRVVLFREQPTVAPDALIATLRQTVLAPGTREDDGASCDVEVYASVPLAPGGPEEDLASRLSRTIATEGGVIELRPSADVVR